MGRHFNRTPSYVENVSINLRGALSMVSLSSTSSKIFNRKATDCHVVISNVVSSDKLW